ncbi:MAG: hypothetical protein Q6361_02795, partial [Candidatus Hermodarchaeota archaeon]|nr:hypothetical protein [Candidatus Hermodarchaeota archaeon]
MATTVRNREAEKEEFSPNQRRHNRQMIKKRLHTVQAHITELTHRTPVLPSKIQFFDDQSLTTPTFCGT